MVRFLVGERLIVEPIKENIKQSQGGLLLAEKHREDNRGRRALVVKVGEGKAVKSIIKEGDEIYFDRFAGFGLELNDVMHTVIGLDDVIVVL